MLQRYKLRLGDGTVLVVDQDGLGTWLVDGQATVQAGKSRNWIPLRKFLAHQRAATARQARREAATSASRAADSPSARRGDGLPLVAPPPREETPPPALTSPPREDRLPLVPPPPPREETPPSALMPPRGDEPPLLAPPDAAFIDLSPLERGGFPHAAAHPAEGDPTSDVVAPPSEDDRAVKITVGKPRVVQAAAEEPALAGSDARADATLDEELPVVSVGALTALEAPHSPPEPALTEPAPAEPAEPVHLGEPHGIQALAEEPVPFVVRSGPAADLSVIPLKPLEDEEPVRTSSQGGPGGASDSAGASGPSLAARPPESHSEAPLPSGAHNRPVPLEGDGPFDEALWRQGRAVPVHRLVASFGAFLSRCLDPINRLERGLPPFPIEKPSDGLPVIPLEPLDEDETPSWGPTKGQQLLTRAKGWLEKPTAWVAGLAQRDRPGHSEEPEARQAAAPAPREALQAPPAVSQLPVLRFATTNEPAVVEEIYGGDDSESLVPVAWLWTKRLVLAAVALAGVTLAALTFETWSPKAAKIGQTTLTEIDGRVRSLHLARQRQKAVDEVAGELPHLGPETIRLVMSSSPTGLLDAKGVFELASDAADRGVSALTASDAWELKALRQRLLDGLLAAERGRLREYDRARARDAVFPLDNRQALRVYARGARRLPSESRERLQVLLGRAVAAALAVPGSATTRTAAER